MLLSSALVSGLALGSMYGLLALGFHITYAVSGTVNFSQGSSMTLGAVLGYFLLVLWGWPALAGVPLVLFLCALYGLAVERFAVRPFASRGSDSWLMATVAIGIVVDNLVLFTFGKEPRGFPSPLAVRPIQLAAGVYPLQLVIPLVAFALAARYTCSCARPASASPCLRWCRTRTRRGSWGSTCARRSPAATSPPACLRPSPGC